MHRRSPFFFLWLMFASAGAAVGVAHPAAAAPPAPQSVAGPDAAAAQAAVKGLVGGIRYGKDNLALKRLGTETMAHTLLGDSWQKADPKDRQHFVQGFGELLAADAFVRGREMFRYLDALLFAAPARVGEQLHLACTIVVHRELKKVEIPVTWVLGQEDGTWRVVDIVAQKESTLTGLREEQIDPLLKEGGMRALLQALDARVAKVKKDAPAAKAAAPTASTP